MKITFRAVLAFSLIALAGTMPVQAAPLITLTAEQEAQCLSILRETLADEEFWPAMHAAEGLTLAGHGDEVIAAVAPMLDTVTDLQHRCGLARELVRAGDRSKASILLDLIDGPDPYAHIHAAESSYKVWVLGDGEAMRKAFADKDTPTRAMMAAAALARWGNPDALAYVREQVNSDVKDTARIAAWILGRVGDASDLPALRDGEKRFDDILAKGFFVHAMAALGDPAAIVGLEKNLSSSDATVRTMAATFAGEIGLHHLKWPLLGLLDDPHYDAQVRAAQSLLQMARDVPPAPKGVVVSEVYAATEENPRYSEGDVHVLNDGRLLYGTTEFMNDWSDFAKARIVGRISADGGQTWGDKVILQENIGKKNIMSLTFQQISDDAVGMFYLHKNDFNDLDVYLRRSTDGGLTFETDGTLVTDMPGYHVMNNDRVVRLSSGRLLAPVAWSEDVHKVNHFTCRTWISDDGGVSWRAGAGTVDYAKRGAMEPECLEMKDGRVLMIFRNQLGHIGAAYSEDGGDNWGEPMDWGVRAPEAPATLRRIPSTGDLLLVWNDNFTEGEGHGGQRSPLTVAISKDEGKTWIHKKNIEVDAENPSFMSGYSYISATFDSGRVLLSYYVSKAGTKEISSRFRSLPISWLYE